MKKVIEVSTKKWVNDGPQLYVAKLIHYRGSISTHKIWDEYLKDRTVEDRSMIPSKRFLKEKVLNNMLLIGKLKKGEAIDFTRKNSKHGWELVPHKAFKNVDPVVLAQMKPLPEVDRKDYREYLLNNDIQHNF